MEEQTPLNKDYIIQSLTDQNANLSLGNAQRDSVITTQQEKIQELQQELGQLKTEEKQRV